MGLSRFTPVVLEGEQNISSTRQPVLRWSMPGHTQTSWCMPPNMWKHILRRPTICTAVICIRHLFAHMQRSKTVLSKIKLCLHLGIISIINKTWIFFLIRLIVVNLNNKQIVSK